MQNPKKMKILTISDNPYSPSGVGMQTRYMIESLLETGNYQFVSLGGAIKHLDYRPIKQEKYGADWITYPVDEFGTPELVRALLANEKPEAVWIMTDPRFWGWLWSIENEIRSNVPLVYYHVWDNYPYPKYNKYYYDSNDVIVSISKLTNDIVANVSPDVQLFHIPHAVPTDVFHKRDILDENVQGLADSLKDKVTFLWNNRNARRKQSGTLIFWFKEFLDIVGHDKANLIMHTEPSDPNGQDLEAILHELDLLNGEVIFSTEKTGTERLADMYNLADCTVNISDAEGFGLATLESLACETPIIVTMTGGLQEQVTDGTEWFGVGIEPSSKSIIGSQLVPYIFEDRISKQDFLDAMLKIFNMTPEERAEVGKKGRGHVLANYGFGDYTRKWDEAFQHIRENMGSWEDRTNYKSWEFKEVA
jgi:glycosyltransferase involved in cell wall biosynthesis